MATGPGASVVARATRAARLRAGVASPLLANIYMNRFLKYWRLTGRGEAFRAHVVAYADDFVILSRGHAAEALAWTKVVMTRLGLNVNEAKTSLKNARQERFDFLGYSFGPHRYKANGLWYLSASPSKKSVQRFKTKVGNLLVPGNNDPWPEVRDTLNGSLLGWSNYFCQGTCRSAFRGVDQYVYERVRDFLARRHKMAGRGTKRFSRDVSHKSVFRTRSQRPNPAPHLATKLSGFKRPALSTRNQVRNTNLISEPRVATSSRVSGSDRSESFNQLRRNLRGPVLTAIGKKKVPP